MLSETLAKTILFAGHYGSGKTNMALALAVALKKAGRDVTVIDMDIINPYFRLADGSARLDAHGIDHIAPLYANTNVDIPVLPPKISALINSYEGTLVIDVGGDDTGAAALGGYAKALEARGYEMILAVNCYRPFTGTYDEAMEVAAQIEHASHLKFTGLAANPNLGRETTPETIRKALPFTQTLAAETGLPIVMTGVREDLVDAVKAEISGEILPIEILDKPGWEIY
ncbi:MAG: ParA family protein [Clostridia bacterium]|nr:ParA family protein [Clostridia bacterium]